MVPTWTYPIEICPEAGEYHAYASTLPEAVASGSTPEEALAEMREALSAAVRGRMKDGMDLPVPPGLGRWEERDHVTLPAHLAAKASIYAAWKAADVSKSTLARRMGRDEAEVRRILDPDHGTKLDQLEEAAKALGGSLAIGFTPA